jgi:flagellar hook-associated protein 2
MTDISGGSLAQSGSRIFITGTASGLDTAGLIEAAVAQKTFKADKIDIQIADNSAKKAAYSQLQSLSQNVQSALERLTNPQDLATEVDSVFGQRGGFVTTSDGSDSTSLAAITVDNGADIGSYDIEILQSAEAMKVRGAGYADQTADLNYTGSFDIGLAGGATATINVASTDSLQEVAALINAQVDTTGVKASVLKVSETEFQLVLTAEDTNKAIEVTNVAGDDVLNLTGVTDGVGGFNNIIQAPQEAIVEVDGVQITRDDNEFDDVLNGVAITVRNAAPGTILTLDVDNDAQAVKDSILNFITAYNELRDFITLNRTVDSAGNVPEGAELFSDNLLDQLSFDLSSLIGSDFGINTSTIPTIRDLGIRFDSNNKLVINDETKLDNALLNDYEEVQAFFSSNATSDNPQFRLLQNTSSGPSQDIVFDVTVDGGGNITGVTANGDGSAFTIDGTRLIGAVGTAYEGLTFSYQGAANATINASVKQGLADRLVNRISDYADSATGLIQSEKDTLDTENTTLAKEAEDIRTRAENFRESQIEKYAKLEANLESLRLLKNQLRALFGIKDDE